MMRLNVIKGAFFD